MLELVCFYVDERELATPIASVRETVPLRPITPVFRVPHAFAGITNLRGEILAVLDLRALLGLPPQEAAAHDARIVVVEDGGRSAGLVVDRVGAIRSLGDTPLQDPPPTLPAPIARLLAGIVSLPDTALPVLEPARLFAAPELSDFVRPPRAPRNDPAS